MKLGKVKWDLGCWWRATVDVRIPAFFENREVAPGAVLESRDVADTDEGEDRVSVSLRDQFVVDPQGERAPVGYARDG